MSQLFGNRAQRRTAKKLAKQTGGVLVHPDQLEQLHQGMQMLHAIVKTQGRVRFEKATIEALNEGDRINFKHDGPFLILTYEAAAKAEEQTG